MVCRPSSLLLPLFVAVVVLWLPGIARAGDPADGSVPGLSRADGAAASVFRDQAGAVDPFPDTLATDPRGDDPLDPSGQMARARRAAPDDGLADDVPAEDVSANPSASGRGQN